MNGWSLRTAERTGVFAPEEARTAKGYIPRDVAEALLGRSMEGAQWFTLEESETMRAHPEWRLDMNSGGS